MLLKQLSEKEASDVTRSQRKGRGIPVAGGTTEQESGGDTH